MQAQDTSAGESADLQPEIAHLLLIDIVGYSKLIVNEQLETVKQLNRIVRSTSCFCKAEKQGKLIRLPTGDGMALLFFQSPEEPARCALEISDTLRNHPDISVRMGVHSGPVNQVSDVNDQANFAGTGLNIAQRVMDCGDAGHILLSKHVADDLSQYIHWQPFLHDLGECEVKHGLRLHIVNLYKDGLGNHQVPQKFRRGRRWRQTPSQAEVRAVAPSRIPMAAIVTAVLLSCAAVGVSAWVLFRRGSAPFQTGAAALTSPDKSIAVMPFENLSDDKQNAYFADGVQDEILTNLARVADLKVISRTSMMQYKTRPQRNLREIAETLGVSHIVEGSVQRSGGRVRVNAQLIDAKSDKQLWGQSYDREIADVFAIENELAEQIVDQLQSKLSPQEKAAMEEKPTTDLAAYDWYIRAKTLIGTAVYSTPLQEGLLEAVDLLNQAIERDPAFALAYYQIAHVHDLLYFGGIDHTPARLAMAEAAIQSLARLRPNSGETHLALAKHFYWGHLDYDRARNELTLAQKSLPNESLAFVLAGYIDRRQGRWIESNKNLERAIELDPQNPRVLQQIASSYSFLRRYADEERALDRAIALVPKEVAALRAARAEVELRQHADPRPLISVIEAIVAKDSGEAKNVAEMWLRGSLCERDFDAAARALTVLPIAGCYDDAIPFPRTWCEGIIARMRGDKAAADTAFTTTRIEAAKLVADQPDYAEAHCVLGMADAALGHKDDAIREGRRAVELSPVAKDAIIGPRLVEYLAVIYAWTGEKDLALEQLVGLARIPSLVSYGGLRLHPYWDPLRGDPRFDKIVASLAPKN